MRGDQKTTRECYAVGLKMYPREERRKVSRSEVAIADLDPCTNTKDRLEPLGELQLIMLGTNASHTMSMAKWLEAEAEKKLRAVLWQNRDLFAWTVADMAGIHVTPGH